MTATAHSAERCEALFRVQDVQGRGPYRPGLPDQWADYDATDHFCPPFFVEMGWALSEVPSHFTEGWHGGCAFRSLADLYRWFAPRERVNLVRLGFRINRIRPDRIIAETPTQVIFECRRPLRDFWNDVAASLLVEREAA